MRIYLLNPPFVPNFVRCGRWQGAAARSGGMDYPKWLAYATALLETKYSDVRLVDAPASKKTREDVISDAAAYQPDLIVVETNFSSLNNDIEVIKKLKETVPCAVTVIVGPPAAQFAEYILGRGGTDIIARYEYDYTVLDIASVLERKGSLDSVTGISHIKDGKVQHNPDREYTTSEDLDRIPFVSRVYKKHLNVYDYYLSQSLYPQIQIFTGRGCPNQCTFCSWPKNLMGRKYRVRSIDSVLDEFEYIAKELPFVKEVFIEDDTFTIDKKRIAEFCNKKMERGLKGTWSCNARATLDFETLKLMKKAGCRLLIVGFESGSEEILKTIKKGVSTERMKQFTRDAKKAGLMVHGDFIIGLPGETKETAEQTLRLIKELKPNILQVAVATPLPGTEFYTWAKENGHVLVDDLNQSIDASGFQKCILSYPQFTREDIEAYVTRALKEYYLSPSFVPVAFSNVLRKNGLHELKSMMTSARTFLRYIRVNQ
jgi:Fe-S oxidoreductase